MRWFLDTETTGLNGPAIEVALVPEVGEGWSSLIDQSVPIEVGAFKVHGISTEECRLKGMDEVSVAAIIGHKLKDGDEVYAHNAAFDKPRIEGLFARAKLPMPQIVWKCTLEWSRLKVNGSHRLENLAQRFGFAVGGHRALGDAMACRDLYFHLMRMGDVVAEPVATYAVEVDRPGVGFDGWGLKWKCAYTKADGSTSVRVFKVLAVDFQRGQFIVWEYNKAAERCFKFDRFLHPKMAEAIVKMEC